MCGSRTDLAVGVHVIGLQGLGVAVVVAVSGVSLGLFNALVSEQFLFLFGLLSGFLWPGFRSVEIVVLGDFRAEIVLFSVLSCIKKKLFYILGLINFTYFLLVMGHSFHDHLPQDLHNYN